MYEQGAEEIRETGLINKSAYPDSEYERLKMMESKLLAELENVRAAIEMLDKHPEIKEVLKALAKVKRFI